jgi:hypothetical protein
MRPTSRFAVILAALAGVATAGCAGAADPLGGPYGGTGGEVAPNERRERQLVGDRVVERSGIDARRRARERELQQRLRRDGQWLELGCSNQLK